MSAPITYPKTLQEAIVYFANPERNPPLKPLYPSGCPCGDKAFPP